MATRGYKVPLTEDGKEVPGYLMGFTGEDLKKLENLKQDLDLKEEQDVVRLAVRMLEKLIDPKPKIKVKSPPNKIRVTLKKHGVSDEQ